MSSCNQLDQIRSRPMSIRLTLPTHMHRNPHERAKAFAHASSRRHRRPFDFPTTLVGTTPDNKVTLYYDPELATPGANLAKQVFANVGKTYANCQAYFGVAGQPVNVIIAPVGGATDGS